MFYFFKRNTHRHFILTIPLILILFQNCGQGFKFNADNQINSDTNSTSTQDSSSMTQEQLFAMGKSLYENNCLTCHGALTSNTIKLKTEPGVFLALSNEPLMSPLKSKFTGLEIKALVEALAPTSTTPPPEVETRNNPTVPFACKDDLTKKFSSAFQRRLTGEELKNTYSSILPSAVLTSVSSNFSTFLPNDQVGSQISNFNNYFSAEQIDNISKLNDLISTRITTDVTTLRSFFGDCASLTAFPQTCFNTFSTTLLPKILRSNLSATELNNIFSQISAAASVPQQYQILVNMLFAHPRFLHHLEEGTANPDSNGLIPLSPFEIANRISYGMTSFPPDATLFAAAQSGQLGTIEQISAQVDRLALTDQFKNRILSFARYYLVIDLPTVFNNTSFLNGLDTTGVILAANSELDEFIKYVIFDLNGSFKDLLTSDYVFPGTSNLAAIMQTSVWNGTTEPNRSTLYNGILSRPYFLMTGSPNVSIIQRGVKLRRFFLCDSLATPASSNAGALNTITEADYANLTNLQRINKLTSSAACAACHQYINDLGSVLGQFDQLGRFTTSEKSFNSSLNLVSSHPVSINVNPKIVDTDSASFSSLKDFNLNASDNLKVQQCFAKRSFQFMNGFSENLSLDSCSLQDSTNLLTSQQPITKAISQFFKSQSVMYKKVN